MGLELKQQLRLSQQLVMTPQLQQAIKLLQLNHLELAELVGQEIVENPVLEEQVEERPDEIAEAKQAEATPEAAKPEDPNSEGHGEQNDIDWEKYLENYQSAPRTGSGVRPDSEELPGYEQTLTRRTSLAEHLIWQLHMVDADKDILAAAASIVGNLNDDGYLSVPIDEIAQTEGVPAQLLEPALALVQTLDPLGVGCRNLRECLLIQARFFHPEDRVLLSIVDQHIDSLERKDYKTIARLLGVSFQRVADSVRLLAELEPKPGRPFSDEDPQYITPDIYVIKSGNEYVIQLNEEGVPKLRVSDYYRRVLRGAQSGDKEYIKDKLRSAQWLIRSIYQRQRTIYKVTESIVRQQRSFFDEGIARLRPMILRDVADDIGMHESTVSRVTTNKYVHTPHGIFPLKFFFNSSIRREDGEEDVASEMVKQRIAGLVQQENPRKPFSDQQLVQLLAKENIKIARRTVAKYRDMLRIPSSGDRRRLI